jgi:two-component system phosphate regulon sensor histidine kinase PhoR
MLRTGLKAAVWCCLGVIAACTLSGLIAGNAFLGLAIGSGGCLIWLLVQIGKLGRWINHTRRTNTPPRNDLTGIWVDISYDIQRLMARQEKEKMRLQTLVHRVQEMTAALTDAVILVDKRGNIEWWNQAATRSFEFRDQDRGHKLTNLIRHPQFVQYFDQETYLTPLELTLWRKEQRLEFQVHIFGEGERLVIARDITRLFKLEQMRKDFVANVSHELRTPLTVILGYLETLADSPTPPLGWQSMIQQMAEQGQRMSHLVNDLLTLSKLETDQKETASQPIALGTLLDRVAEDARALSGERRHEVVLSGTRDLGLIGNEGELRSAFSNLVVNAIHYSPAGSRIDIHYDLLPQGAVVRVRDQGIGIDPKHLPRITERFYRVDPGRSANSGGTGLGLAIVKHVLLRHDAELRINSQLGKGSEFACHFPANRVFHLPATAQNSL